MSLIQSLLKQGAEQFELSQQAQADVQQLSSQEQTTPQADAKQAQTDEVELTISSISGADEQQASESMTIVEQLLKQGAQQVMDEQEPTDTQPDEVVDEVDDEVAQPADVAEPFNEVAQPDEQVDEQVADEVAEKNAQLTEIVERLEKEREEIAKERADFQRQMHEMQAQLLEANQRAEAAERERKQVHLSNALIGRDDIKDARLVARLINLDELDSDDLAHSIMQKVNEVLRNYPTLAVDSAESYISRNVDGLTVMTKTKPIGKPMGQSDRDNGANKATELEKLRKRAIRSGSEVDRVAYAKAKRALGLVKEVGRR